MELSEEMKLFLSALRELGGTAGNKALREKLRWQPVQYWTAHEALYQAGYIAKGRGKGGSVQLIEKADPIEVAGSATEEPIKQKEIELYDRCLKSLQDSWIKERSYDESIARVTAHQGRRSTGGSWTRPDITIVGIARAEHFPEDQVEYITFEVKKSDDVSVLGVYEALSHQKALTHSYVTYCTNQDAFGKNEQYRRIMAAAGEHGIGVILLEDIDDPESWNELLESRRGTPSPMSVDRFITDSFDDNEKKKIRQWCRR